MLAAHPLHNSGGIARGLNTRLTAALVRFLSDNAPTSLRVVAEPASAPFPASPAPMRYSLEGDLSYASGANDANARFLLVTRLFRDGDTRALVGQWAGTADSLRSLTVNLRRDPRVHALGLVGETGSRVLACLHSDQQKAGTIWHRLLSHLAPADSPVEIVSTDGRARPLRQIIRKEAFRLRISTHRPCRVLLLAENILGELHIVPLSPNGDAFTTEDKPPETSLPVTVPEDTTGMWILTEYVSEHAEGKQPTCREDLPPVQMLDGVGISGAHDEITPAVQQLLAAIARTPQNWRVQRVRMKARN